jgi:hypothetical protein
MTGRWRGRMTEVRYCSTCRHWPGDDHCAGCRYEAGANTKWEPQYETTFDKIISEIEREADYQDAEVNADIAKGMYKAIEIVEKYKTGGKND